MLIKNDSVRATADPSTRNDHLQNILLPLFISWINPLLERDNKGTIIGHSYSAVFIIITRFFCCT